MKIFIGIDPGKKGGIGIIDENKAVLFLKSNPNETIFEAFVECTEKLGFNVSDMMLCLEEVHAMPKQGVSSMFTFGRSFGFIEGVIAAYSIPNQLIKPQLWKKEFGLNSDKKKSIEVCKGLFPNVSLKATTRCTTDNDGMAEALLMAEYARRKL